MAGIPATGLGSGLDVNGLVDKLMEVEKQPLAKLQTKQAAVNVKISAYGTFKGAVSTLRTSLAGVQSNAAYSTMSAKIADTSVANVSASQNADVGTHSLEVTQLAAAHRLKSGTFTNITDPVGTGTLQVQYGTVAQNGGSTTFTVNGSAPTNNIVIDAAHNSLAGVRDAINQSNAGVSASIVNDGTGYRLVLSGKNTGTANSIRIGVTDDDGNNTNVAGLSQLSYDPTVAASAGKNMGEVSAAKDAQFLLDGLQITKSSNTVGDAISGVTLDLQKANAGSPTTFSVAKDTSTIKQSIDDFVKAYNDLDTTVDQLTAYDPKTRKAGELNGDTAVRNTYEQIRSSLGHMVSAAPGGYTALAQIGLTLDRNGQIQVDGTKLQAALDKDAAAVQGLFATAGKTTDSLVSYVKAGDSAKPGQYPLSITQLATQGNAVGSAAAPLTIDATNNALTLKIDGVTSNVSLTQKTYASAAELAGELQTQINGTTAFSSAKIKVAVTQNAGVLSITSNRYGAASAVELSGNNVSTLFGSVTSTAGVDVAGSIGTGKTTGNGQELTSADGLTVKITGGTLGDRGNVTFMRGLAVQLDSLIGRAVDAKGILPEQIESLNQQNKDFDKQTADLNAQLELKEKRYLKQFNSLDQMLTNMQSQMSYMSQQLSALNKG
jgi:flagellar hook-associated protein 2